MICPTDSFIFTPGHCAINTVKLRKEEPTKLRTNKLFFKILYLLDKSQNQVVVG